MSYLGVEPGSRSVRTSTVHTAASGQNTYVVNGGYTKGYVDVFINGTKTLNFTATDNQTVVLSSNSTLNDKVEIIAYSPLAIYSVVSKAGDAMSGDLTLPNLISTGNVGGSNGYFVNLKVDSNTYINNSLTIAGNSTQVGNFTLTGNLNLTGSLIITGEATSVTTQSLAVEDSIITMAANNVLSDTLDIGFAGKYNNGAANVWTGLIRNATDKEFYFFQEYDTTPGNDVDITDPSFQLANVHANFTGNVQSNNITVVQLNATNLNMTSSITLTGDASGYRQDSTTIYGGAAGAGYGRIEYHANKWVFNAGSDSANIAFFQRGNLVKSWIDNDGNFSGTANDASNLGGTAAASYLQTSGSYTISGVRVHTANLEVRTANLIINSSASIIANGTIGTAGQVLTSNGSTVYWGVGGGSSVAGSNTQIQFNDSGSANGSAGLTFNKATNTLSVSNIINVGANVSLTTANLAIGNTSANVYVNSTAFVGNVVATSISGNLAGNVVATTISGNLTGNVAATTISGNLTGNVIATTISGNLTGNVAATTITGNLTGNVSATTISASANVSVGTLFINSTAFVGNVVATSVSGNLTGNVIATTITGNLTGNVAATVISGNLTGNVLAGTVNATTINATSNVVVGANVNIDTAKASFGNSTTINAPQVIVANTSGTTTINTNFISTTSLSGNLTGNVTAISISGNLTGNVAATTITGNLTGNVAATTITGNLTGNVSATVISSGNTTITGFINVTSNSTFGGSVTVAGITTLSANVILGTSGLSANGGFGTDGHVLHSNGTATYWAADDQGVTSVASGNGITGGTITSTGTLTAVAGAGMVVNTSGINILANSGIVANSTGTFVNAQTPLVANATGLHIATSAGNGTFTSGISAITVDSVGRVTSVTGSAGYVTSSGVTSVASGNGITGGTITATGTLTAVAGAGMVVNTTGINILANTGIVANTTGAFVNANYIATISSNNATFINGNNVLTVMESLRANRNINGGGTITVDASGNVLWSSRFIVISNGRGSHFSTAGYYDINCPTSGTITGVGGAANKTATAAGIPLAQWEAIYYILPIGSNNASVAANFRVASYTSDVEIPSDWVLICVRNGDDGLVYFNNGIHLDLGQSYNATVFSSALVPTANNTTYVNGKTEGNLNVNSASYANASITNTFTVGTGSYFVSNGNVGIATATPDALLTVAGTANVSGNSRIGGIATLAANVVLGTTTISANGGVGSAGQVLTSGGAGNVYWSTAAAGVNAAAQYSWTNTHSFAANVTFATTAALIANSSAGTAGHVLHSNGSSVYWAADNDSGGTVTSVASGNGITGGTITATGTLSAVAGAGMVVNTSGINILANTGIVANTTGAFVNATYIGTLSANNTTYVNGKTEGNLNVNNATTATTATNWGTYGGVPAAGTSFGNASTIGRSDVNGYTYFFYINSNTSNSENPTVSQIIVTNGSDNFYRKASIAHLTSAVQTNASGTWNITANNASFLGTVAAASYSVLASTETMSGRKTFSAGQSSGSLLNATGGLGGIEIYGGGSTNAAFMTFHRPGAYAAYFGLDNDSQFAVGGWSAGAALANMKVGSFGVGTAASGTAGEIRATNNITAYYSDRRLKTNISRIEDALSKIERISGVTFQSNEEAEKYGYTDKRVQVGVIAQEIEAVLPQVVVPAPFDIARDDDGNEYSKSGENYKTVQYEKLVPLLIEAIKELSYTVKSLQRELKELRDS
jgi:hypothetical protein